MSYYFIANRWRECVHGRHFCYSSSPDITLMAKLYPRYSIDTFTHSLHNPNGSSMQRIVSGVSKTVEIPIDHVSPQCIANKAEFCAVDKSPNVYLDWPITQSATNCKACIHPVHCQSCSHQTVEPSRYFAWMRLYSATDSEFHHQLGCHVYKHTGHICQDKKGNSALPQMAISRTEGTPNCWT